MTLYRLLSAAAALSSLCVTVHGSDSIPLPRPSVPVVLRNATIHPVTGPDLPRADIAMEKGKITAVGPNLPAASNAVVVDLTGLHIYPGLIAADSRVGLEEISAVRATVDFAETGEINPNARAETAVNPDSEIIPVTRANGVLAALSVPRTSGGLIAGTSALLQLDGWTPEELTVRAPVGLHVVWPDLTVQMDPRYPKSPEDQRKDIRKKQEALAEAFASARAYASARAAARPGFLTDVRWEAMLPVLEGRVPVFVHASEVRQIRAAIEYCTREKLRMVLVGGQDAPRVASLLKEHDIPVIINSTFELPLRRQDAYDAAYSCAARLHGAGVRYCIAPSGADAETAHLRNLPYQAGMAIAHGLPPEEGLKAITLYPAQILGVADRLGSLEPGKDATLIITTGDPLEALTTIQGAYIAGCRVDLSNRQTRLRDKYREKQRQLQAR